MPVVADKSLISTYLIPNVSFSGSRGSLNLGQETLTYLPSMLPGTGFAGPVSLNNEVLLATLASNAGLDGLTITSAVRTAQEQAQLMINNLLRLLHGGPNPAAPGVQADQVYNAILGGSFRQGGGTLAALQTLLTDHPDSAFAQFSRDQNPATLADLVSFTANVITTISPPRPTTCKTG